LVSLSHAAQSGTHSHADRGLDLYSTPPCAVEALLCVEQLPHGLWEPAAGHNAITDVLRAAGHEVITSDIFDYGFPLDFVTDFLTVTEAPAGTEAIITNPPYRIATEFARHPLDLAPKVYLLCRLAFLESEKRRNILEHRGLARVLVFRNRLPMMHRHNWAGARASSAIPFGWFVWDRDHVGPTTIERISWTNSSTKSDFQNSCASAGSRRANPAIGDLKEAPRHD
jgi:hypothetical protein